MPKTKKSPKRKTTAKKPVKNAPAGGAQYAKLVNELDALFSRAAKAKAFLTERLRGLPFVVLHSHKTDTSRPGRPRSPTAPTCCRIQG